MSVPLLLQFIKRVALLQRFQIPLQAQTIAQAVAKHSQSTLSSISDRLLFSFLQSSSPAFYVYCFSTPNILMIGSILKLHSDNYRNPNKPAVRVLFLLFRKVDLRVYNLRLPAIESKYIIGQTVRCCYIDVMDTFSVKCRALFQEIGP